MPTVFLVDNGSLRPASTMNLRRLAAELEVRSGHEIRPVSLLHSNAVPPAELEGRPAETVEPALLRRLEQGERDFLLLPLFFGPSLAFTSYLPKRVASLRKKYPEVQVRVASSLFDWRKADDMRLARILADHVRAVLREGEKPAVVVVDHGSPEPEVTYVRNFIAGQLSVLLGEGAARVAAASMERREGDEFRFNEPLLEKIFRTEGFNRGRVILAMMFLSPGRHAGADGDVRRICRAAEEEQPGLETVMTPLVGEHPVLLSILEDRLRENLQAKARELKPER